MPALKNNEDRKYQNYLFSFYNKRFKFEALKRRASTIPKNKSNENQIDYKIQNNNIYIPKSRYNNNLAKKFPIILTFRPTVNGLKKQINNELEKRKTILALRRMSPIKTQENPEYRNLMKEIREMEKETANKMTYRQFKRMGR